jgi:hypothetical protein
MLKYDNLAVDLHDIGERSLRAIKLLKQKKELFGLSKAGVITAEKKINQFVDLLKNYATHKETEKVSKYSKAKKSFEALSKAEKQRFLENHAV